MATIQEKTARLEAARKKVEQFAAAGGDLQSPAAVPVGLELVHAYADVAREFGHEILKPIKNVVVTKPPDQHSLPEPEKDGTEMKGQYVRLLLAPNTRKGTITDTLSTCSTMTQGSMTAHLTSGQRKVTLNLATGPRMLKWRQSMRWQSTVHVNSVQLRKSASTAVWVDADDPRNLHTIG
jgi:hypothetical protein